MQVGRDRACLCPNAGRKGPCLALERNHRALVRICSAALLLCSVHLVARGCFCYLCTADLKRAIYRDNMMGCNNTTKHAWRVPGVVHVDALCACAYVRMRVCVWMGAGTATVAHSPQCEGGWVGHSLWSDGRWHPVRPHCAGMAMPPRCQHYHYHHHHYHHCDEYRCCCYGALGDTQLRAAVYGPLEDALPCQCCPMLTSLVKGSSPPRCVLPYRNSGTTIVRGESGTTIVRGESCDNVRSPAATYLGAQTALSDPHAADLALRLTGIALGRSRVPDRAQRLAVGRVLAPGYDRSVASNKKQNRNCRTSLRALGLGLGFKMVANIAI